MSVTHIVVFLADLALVFGFGLRLWLIAALCSCCVAPCASYVCMLTQLSSRTFFLPQATQSSCNVAPMRYVPGTLGSPDGRASSRLEQTLLYLTTLTLRRSERAFFGSALASLAELWALLCVYLLHMLAMTPTPAIINVCGGASQSTIMSVSGALLLISVLPSNSISMVSMYMLINLLLQCACEVSGLSLLVKGERVSFSVFAAHSVFAFPFVTVADRCTLLVLCRTVCVIC